ncbi:MAG: NADH-quinone oxidoreductase subunit NuoE [Candidatus Atribacteria bacterium]|nr:NADH-quinone oxidoreductase subunit NuoE [Candidatus Atribacteria bacterium]
MNERLGTELVYSKIDEIIDRYQEEKTPLMAILEDVSQIYGYLPKDVLERISHKTGIPSSKIYGVATFYSFFETKPVGRFVIRICKNAPCHVLGATDVLAAVKRELGVKEGETTKNGLFTLEVTSCLGVCGVAPAMMINDVTYGNLNAERIREIFALYR